MLARLQKLVAFFKEVFSEDGRGSFSRVIQGFIVLMTCSWVTYVVLRTRAIPDLTSPATFIGAGSLHYVANKIPSMISAFKSTENGQNPPQNGQQ
jgi:hypothetical protein